MRSVVLPPPKPDWASIVPWAATVPAFTIPPVKVNVPSTVIVLPALRVLVPDRNCTLLKVAAPPRFNVTLLVEKTTVPLLTPVIRMRNLSTPPPPFI